MTSTAKIRTASFFRSFWAVERPKTPFYETPLVKVRKSEWATIYPSVRYATAERFENSYLTENFSDDSDTPSLCPTSGGSFLDEDCLKMSIILPNLKYYNSVIYFQTEETHDLDYLENLAYDRKTAIFTVSLRSETLGYFQSPVIQSDLINSLRWIAQNLETFELYPENVMIFSSGHINELLFDLFIRFQDLSVLQIPFNIFFIQLRARICFRKYKEKYLKKKITFEHSSFYQVLKTIYEKILERLKKNPNSFKAPKR